MNVIEEVRRCNTGADANGIRMDSVGCGISSVTGKPDRIRYIAHRRHAIGKEIHELFTGCRRCNPERILDLGQGIRIIGTTDSSSNGIDAGNRRGQRRIRSTAVQHDCGSGKLDQLDLNIGRLIEVLRHQSDHRLFRQRVTGRRRDCTQRINLFDGANSADHAAGNIKNQYQRIRRYRRCRNPDIGVVNNRRVINNSNLQLRSQRCRTRRFDVAERFNDAGIVCGCRIGSG